jgi:hypothetical protein
MKRFSGPVASWTGAGEKLMDSLTAASNRLQRPSATPQQRASTDGQAVPSLRARADQLKLKNRHVSRYQGRMVCDLVTGALWLPILM